MKHLKTCAVGAIALATLGLAANQMSGHGSQGVEAAATMDVFPVNTRQSFRGKLATGNTKDTTMVYIKTTFDPANDVYSTTSAQLVNGDVVHIGGDRTNLVGDVYNVAFTSVQLKDSEIALNSKLTESYAEGTEIYSAQSGDVKITIKSGSYDTTNGAAGAFEFLVPATSEAEISSDGVPDAGGFDMTAAAEIVCQDGTKGTLVKASDANATLVGNTYYHSFKCSYTDASQLSGDLSFTIKGLINPAPAVYDYDTEMAKDDQNLNHYNVGSMDAYNIRGNQLDSNGVWVKNYSVYVGYGDAVKMTVRVMPQLTFKLEGYNTSDTVTGGYCTDVSSIQVDSTGYAVPFGSISNTNFTDAAQKMSIQTNAPHGYVITAIANDQMGIDGHACPGNGNRADCIPGFNYDPNSSSSDAARNNTTVAAAWDDTTTPGNGFGYTLKVVEGDDYLNTAGTPNVTLPGITDADVTAKTVWRAFADRSAMGSDSSQYPVQIVNNARSTNGDVIDVCYRIKSSTSNIAGDYQATLTYTITASF